MYLFDNEKSKHLFLKIWARKTLKGQRLRAFVSILINFNNQIHVWNLKPYSPDQEIFYVFQ